MTATSRTRTLLGESRSGRGELEEAAERWRVQETW
jgi:hypothetical protein